VSFRGKILVIRGGAIGDFILTLPAIQALRHQFPEAFLEILGYPHIAQLAMAGGLVNKVQSIEASALAGFFARNGTLNEDLCDYFSEFDLIISYLYDPDGIFHKNVARCSTAQFIAGPHRPDEKVNEHATKVFLKPLERLAIFDADPMPRLKISDMTAAPPDAGPLLALHPGSGSDSKNWPEASWAELLEQLVHQTTFNFLMIGGEAEGERLQRLSAALPPARMKVAQSIRLPDLGKLLGTCNFFIGHDSGISHLAAAMEVPGILLWNQSNDVVWRPPSEKMVLLRDQIALERLPVSSVIAALRAAMGSAFR
jgi:heptosyltransferase-3